jgi:hypothetical protein
VGELSKRRGGSSPGALFETALRASFYAVMPGLVPGIHVFAACRKEDVDGRVKPGHDGIRLVVVALSD